MNKPCEYSKYECKFDQKTRTTSYTAIETKKGTLLAFGVDTRDGETFSTAIINPEDGGTLINVAVECVRILGDD